MRIPILADTRFPEGAILSARGPGAFIGVGLDRILPRPKPRHTGTVLLGLAGTMGIGLAMLGVSRSMNFAAGIGLPLCAIHGYMGTEPPAERTRWSPDESLDDC